MFIFRINFSQNKINEYENSSKYYHFKVIKQTLVNFCLYKELNKLILKNDFRFHLI